MTAEVRAASTEADLRARGGQHIRWGCLALLFFLLLGFALEIFHAFRISWYLGEHNDPRRMMWTLAHAHGTLLALINIAIGAAWPQLRLEPALVLASRCLYGSLLTLPLGFFLGGLFVVAPDPGLGIVLVPIGGLLLFAGVALVARQA